MIRNMIVNQKLLAWLHNSLQIEVYIEIKIEI